MVNGAVGVYGTKCVVLLLTLLAFCLASRAKMGVKDTARPRPTLGH